MRVFALAAIATSFVYSATVEDEDDFEFEDDPVPLADEEVNFDEEALAKDEEEAQKIDADLTQEDKRKRMGVCLSIVREQVSNPDSDLQEYISKFSEAMGDKITPQQVLEYLHMDFIKNCYLSIPQNIIGSEISDVQGKSLILSRAAPRTLHRSQWEILSEVLKSESSADRSQLNMELLGGRLQGWQKVAYVLAVVSVVFGLGYYVLMSLTKAERARAAAKESKKTKKNK
jgi:hypothetical protein